MTEELPNYSPLFSRARIPGLKDLSPVLYFFESSSLVYEYAPASKIPKKSERFWAGNVSIRVWG
jgi:hypothetical protein